MVYGKLRITDLSTIQLVVELFRQQGLCAGLHGTSLWNGNYKDVDLLVFSSTNNVSNFLVALEKLTKDFGAKIVSQRGTQEIGLDYDIVIEKTILHISYVVVL